MRQRKELDQDREDVCVRVKDEKKKALKHTYSYLFIQRDVHAKRSTAISVLCNGIEGAIGTTYRSKGHIHT